MSNGALQILQKSLQDAHKSLESTNDAIKKLTGRDPAVTPSRPGPTPERRISGGGRMRAWSGDYESPAAKRRDPVGGRTRLAGRLGVMSRTEESPGGERKAKKESEGEGPAERGVGERRMRWRDREGEMPAGRGGERWRGRRNGEERGAERRREEDTENRLVWRGERRRRRESEGNEQEQAEEEEERPKPVIQSSVVATTAPPRPNADPNEDGKNKLRNRRMFGFLMGTLQKFKEKEEAAKNSDKEKHRKEIEKKLEETALAEKEVAVQERKGLFQQRKAHKIRVARIESHLETVAEYEEWNAHSRKLLGYIQTRNKPPIFYLPAQQNSDTEELVKKTRAKFEEAINARQKEINIMLSQDTVPLDTPQEGGGGGGGKEMDTREDGSSVREGGGEVRKRKASAERGKRGKAASESGEASESE